MIFLIILLLLLFILFLLIASYNFSDRDFISWFFTLLLSIVFLVFSILSYTWLNKDYSRWEMITTMVSWEYKWVMYKSYEWIWYKFLNLWVAKELIRMDNDYITFNDEKTMKWVLSCEWKVLLKYTQWLIKPISQDTRLNVYGYKCLK